MEIDPKAARTALQALGVAPGARLLPADDLVLTLLPRQDGLQPKDIDVDQLLHKVTMMRDKLRVLEQRLNAADGPSTTERATLQAHVTAVAASFVGLVSFFSVEALPNGTDAAATPTATTAPLGKTITRSST